MSDEISADERTRMRDRAESLRSRGGALNVMSVAVLRPLDALESAERELDEARKTGRLLVPVVRAVQQDTLLCSQPVEDALHDLPANVLRAICRKEELPGGV